MPRPRPTLAALHRSLGIPADYGRRRKLRAFREARRLVSIGPAADDGRRQYLAPAAAAAWRRMQAAAAADGRALLALSGFRSVARQTRLIRRKLAAGQSLDAILAFVAAPGFSEHHTGRALDIGAPGALGVDEAFGRTPEYRWLRNHAWRFGFRLSFPRGNPHGIRHEPWHWCWHPGPRIQSFP